MEITKSNETYCPMIFIRDPINEITLKMFYGDDLMWQINYPTPGNSATLTITEKDDSVLFDLMERMWVNIKNANIIDTFFLPDPLSEEDLEAQRAAHMRRITKEKERIKKNEKYSSLALDDSSAPIIWHSDYLQDDQENTLEIEKDNDEFKLTFTTNSACPTSWIPIKFCTSGGRYDGFYVPFSNLYNGLIKYLKSKEQGKAITMHPIKPNQ